MARSIAHARRVRKLSLKEAADAAAVNISTWRRWEMGKTSIPAEMLPKVASVVGLEAHDVLCACTIGDAA